MLSANEASNFNLRSQPQRIRTIKKYFYNQYQKEKHSFLSVTHNPIFYPTLRFFVAKRHLVAQLSGRNRSQLMETQRKSLAKFWR